MAIIFETQKPKVNWMKVIGVIFIAGFFVFAIYYLFFAPSPKIDVVLPAPLQRATQINAVPFIDPATVLGSKAFKNLRVNAGQPSVGALGRSNPFVPF